MRTIACIPARMNSSRFPNKPMALLHGIPMIGHVYHRTKLCPCLDAVYVATCDREIFDYIVAEGGQAVMTADTHEGCIDRCAEALHTIEKESGKKVDIMTIIQGDEPMILPQMIDEAVQAILKDPTVNVVNLMAPLETDDEIIDPNEIKVVIDTENNALYFSREPIPSMKKAQKKPAYHKQVCVIPFRRDFLIAFSKMARTPLEESESIDMLRCLENRFPVRMAQTRHRTWSVDTPGDLEDVEKLMAKDPLIKKYSLTNIQA